MESRIQIPEMKTETETESRIKRKIRKQSSHSIIWSFKIKSQVRKEFVFVIVYRSIKSSHDGVQAYAKSIPALLTMILRRLDKVTQQVFVHNYLRTTFLVSILYILSVWNFLSCANMIYRDDFATMRKHSFVNISERWIRVRVFPANFLPCLDPLRSLSEKFRKRRINEEIVSVLIWFSRMILQQCESDTFVNICDQWIRVRVSPTPTYHTFRKFVENFVILSISFCKVRWIRFSLEKPAMRPPHPQKGGYSRSI